MWLALLIIVAVVAVVFAPMWLDEVVDRVGAWNRSAPRPWRRDEYAPEAPCIEHTTAPARGPPSTLEPKRGVEGVE